MSEELPKRGDLILPFLSYAVNNGKNEHAVEICNKSAKGIEAICDLIKANQILAKINIGKREIQKSIELIEKAIKKGLFNEMIYGFWFNQKNYLPLSIAEGDHTPYSFAFSHWGLKGIPLSSDILFLISDKEKKN